MPITLTRATNAYCPCSNSVVGTNVRRRKLFAVDGFTGAETNADLVEASNTNLNGHSNNVGNNYYFRFSSRMINRPTDFVSTLGYNVTFQEEASNGSHNLRFATELTLTKERYCYSVHVRAKSGTPDRHCYLGIEGSVGLNTRFSFVTMNWATGTSELTLNGATYTRGFELLANGFARLWFVVDYTPSTHTTPTINPRIAIYLPDGSSSYLAVAGAGYYWGMCQIELMQAGQTKPSSYIDTGASSASVTRAADQLVYSGVGTLDTVDGQLALIKPSGVVWSLPASADGYTYPQNYENNLVAHWDRTLSAGERTILANSLTY